jgi:hypothetical protein
MNHIHCFIECKGRAFVRKLSYISSIKEEKIKVMTKTQKRKEVTKRFFTFIEETFPNYYIEDDGFGGRISIVPEVFEGYQSDNWIEYHRSYFNLIVLDSANEQVKQDCELMETKLNEIVKELEL